MNKNKDDFSGVGIVKKGGMVVGVIEHFDYGPDLKLPEKIFEVGALGTGNIPVGGRFKGGHGYPIVSRIIRDLIYLDMLKAAHAQTFFNRYERIMTEEERRMFMEKYGVEIDKDKVEKEKKGSAGSKQQVPDDPNVNVPKDPDKGTEPYEKRPEGE
jgi:hypothetical protein